MRASFVLALLLSACAAPPAPAAREPSPASAPPPPATPAPAPSAKPAPAACTPASAETARLLDDVEGRLTSSPLEAGATRTEHEQLFRLLPALEAGGHVRSIAATHARGAHGPVFVVTRVARRDDGAFRAHLVLAAAPCPRGDLVSLGAPLDLDGADAAIQYVARVNVPTPDARLTDVQIDVADGAMTGARDQRVTHVSVVAGHLDGRAAPGVVGVVRLPRAELAADATFPYPRTDRRLFGTGWYRLGRGAGLLYVHHFAPDERDLCKWKLKEVPHVPPSLRLLARIDERGFTTEPARVRTAFVVGVGENQPTERIFGDPDATCRGGPTAMGDAYFERGPSAQWLYGLFDSADEARARAKALGYTTGSVFSTEPQGGAPAATEPFVVPAGKRRRAPACLFL